VRLAGFNTTDPEVTRKQDYPDLSALE
jgi:hypothetical protein